MLVAAGSMRASWVQETSLARTFERGVRRLGACLGAAGVPAVRMDGGGERRPGRIGPDGFASRQLVVLLTLEGEQRGGHDAAAWLPGRLPRKLHFATVLRSSWR